MSHVILFIGIAGQKTYMKGACGRAVASADGGWVFGSSQASLRLCMQVLSKPVHHMLYSPYSENVVCDTQNYNKFSF